MSEHNHPHQRVGSQYNADAINIHHHGFPSELPPSTAEQIAHAVEQLEQFKTRFASASMSEVWPLLEEAEDLLIFVIGERRLCDLRETAYRCKRFHTTPDDWVVEQHQSLKRRIAGIEFRGRGLNKKG
jgi:hypothetical protein